MASVLQGKGLRDHAKLRDQYGKMRSYVYAFLRTVGLTRNKLVPFQLTHCTRS
jgi:hypothetical protein